MLIVWNATAMTQHRFSLNHSLHGQILVYYPQALIAASNEQSFLLTFLPRAIALPHHLPTEASLCWWVVLWRHKGSQLAQQCTGYLWYWVFDPPMLWKNLRPQLLPSVLSLFLPCKIRLVRQKFTASSWVCQEQRIGRGSQSTRRTLLAGLSFASIP